MMKLQSHFAYFTLVVLLLFSAGCDSNGPSSSDATSSSKAAETEKPVVFVPVLPYAGIVEQIAGDTIEVKTLIGEGQDPHVFNPTPKQIAALTKADVYFTIGMPFEADIVGVLSKDAPNLKIIDLTKDLEVLYGQCEHEHHDHGDEEVFEVTAAELEKEEAEGHDDEHEHHDHEHEELDPHMWLSPVHLLTQVKGMHAVLEGIVSEEDADLVHKNANAFEAELTALDFELARKLKPMKGKSFYVYHGAFLFLCSASGLTQEAIQIAGRSPEPKRLADLIEKAKAEKVEMIFVQPQFDQSSAKVIAEAIGGTVMPIDPLEKDILGNLRNIAAAISNQ